MMQNLERYQYPQLPPVHTEEPFTFAVQVCFQGIQEQLQILSLTETDFQLPQGRINRSRVVADTEGNWYVWRTRKNIPQAYDRAFHELTRIGFIPQGGKISIRSTEEEAQFMMTAAQAGQRVQLPTFADSAGILLPFIVGNDLRASLLGGNVEPLTAALRDVWTAHQKNITYGDRWPQNILVQPDNSIIQVDFDISIWGNSAAELELAQLIYGVLRDAKNKWQFLFAITDFLATHDTRSYNVSRIEEFILCYTQGYVPPENHPQAATELLAVIAELIRYLRKLS